MRVILPSWQLHLDDKDRPTTIFTLAIHPDGSRLATGALDTKIKIWSTGPVLREEWDVEDPEDLTEQNNTDKMEVEGEVKKPKLKVPKLLCTLTSHNGVVMCIRWSNAGRYLASGSDDNVVIIWSIEGGSGGRVFGSRETNIENWKPIRRLVGHESDVSCVAWSHDDEYLASTGFDSTVLIYSGKTFQLLRRLEGHEGFVKAVVFDPIGRYLATQGDDNTLRVWRMSDWGVETVISDPFVGSPKTNITRLSWSPTGLEIVSPNAMNGPTFVAGLVERMSNWSSAKSFVGHENIVDVTAFNPIIFRRTGYNAPNQVCSVFALAARSSISIWKTSSSVALAVFDQVFDRDVVDLSWSTDGTQLWASSSEGHTACLEFQLEELGEKASEELVNSFFGEVYGFQPVPAVKRVPQQVHQSDKQTKPVDSTPKSNILVARKGPNAKRRVQPISQAPHPIPQQTPLQTREDPILTPAPPSQSSITFMPPIQSTPKLNGNAFNKPAQFEQEDDSYYFSSDRFSQFPNRNRGHTLGEKVSAEQWRSNRPAWRELKPAYVWTTKERERTWKITNVDLEKVNKPKVVDEEMEQDDHSNILPPLKKSSWVLAVPGIESFGSIQVEDSELKDALEWRNFAEGERAGTAEIFVQTASKTLWLDYLPRYIVRAAGNEILVAASLEDGTFHTWSSPTGRRLLPIMVLDSPCAFLEVEGSFILAITALGTLSVWDASTSRSIFPPLSILPLLTSASQQDLDDTTITTAALRSNGTPIVALSSGVTQAFDRNLGVWVRIGDSWWSKESEFWESKSGKMGVSSNRGIVKAIEGAINELLVESVLEKSVEQLTPVRGEQHEPAGNEGLYKTAVSLGHLEIRMKAAAELDSSAEYRLFLQMYAKKLGEEGFKNKAEELMKELLGPVYYNPLKKESWNPNVAGLSKRDLLREVITLIGRNRSLSHLANNYLDLLTKVAE